MSVIAFLSGCTTKEVQHTNNRPTNHVESNPVRHSSPASTTSLTMFTSKNGWAITDNGVYYTTTGGSSWENITPQGFPLNADTTVDFLNVDQGWVVVQDSTTTSTIYRTSDAGQTWSQSTISGGTPKDISFVGGKTGAVLLFQGAAMMHEHDSILTTTDGGQHWSKVSETSTKDAAGTLAFVGGKTGISFISSTTGWVTGYTPANGVVYLYRTQDGGKSWAIQHVPVPSQFAGAQFTVQPPQFYSHQTGILPVEDFNSTETVTFYNTTNNGVSWKPTSPLTSTSNQMNMVWSFTDSKHGFVTDGKYLYTTTNGGQSWSKVTPNISMNDVKQVDFVSGKDGWAVMTNGQLFHTVDGGREWERL